MKIVTVVGARPQFIKAAAVSRQLREEFKEILVHTGQHYDANMSEIFFEELDIPKPDYYLSVGSGSHAKQTADILVKTEEVLLKEKPDYLLVYGDTNSTFAAALAASKLLIPVIHVEAGLRSFNMDMPEEQNRILTDHISHVLFCPTDMAVRNLEKENLTDNVFQTGDVMCDAVRYYTEKLGDMPANYFTKKLNYLYGKKEIPGHWYLATMHRAENTRDISQIREVLNALEILDVPVIFPVHPRIRGFIDELWQGCKNVHFVEPLGYLEMLYFTKGAIKVLTDSGGLQKEAYMLGTNVVTLRAQTEWVETLEGNHNILCKLEKDEILSSVYRTDIQTNFDQSLFGDGNAAEKIKTILKRI